MCAIFGSNRVDTFKELRDLNKSRGIFASSSLFFNKNDHYITKSNGIQDLKQEDFTNYSYFAGHVQAPTSCMREWNFDTSHPFCTTTWAVAHNGVLTNHVRLNLQFCRDNYNPVDTSTIAEMLQREKGDEVSVIKECVNRLEGTFALLILNKKTNNLYILRQGSTLFFNDSDFSSIQHKDMVEVPEGVIYLLQDYKKFVEVEKFDSISPFFIL